ncbi:YdcF family protein [Herbaspirillum sp. YR522]|uniref:YdcF family protein n=1 Tax=Herbaspirillum sp. YR522 TaxID=1144342 RepID=UPI00026F76C4|nr:YdcF family protein [Herbaspirillum sp. YR522]EJN03225.1 hypothetical protein PMI40_02774 [Herbaspirillum sp. YR522]
MLLTTLLLILLVAGVFGRYQRLLLSRTLMATAFVLLLAIGCGILPQRLLEHLQAPFASPAQLHWQPRNAIVMLGVGTEQVLPGNGVEVGMFGHGRLSKTLALYRHCRQSGNRCTVVVSGGDARHHGASEAAVYGVYLNELGIDRADLVLESSSMNTWQNAQFTAAVLRDRAHDQVLLVSSGVHLMRSLLYFEHAGVTALPVRADYLAAIPCWIPCSYNFMVTEVALHEYLGLLRYRLYSKLGWNSAVTRPGAL